MFVEEFNNFISRKVKVVFNCPKCGGLIDEEVFVPDPNWEGENFSDSCNQDEDVFECPNCDEHIEYIIQSSLSGGFFFMNDLDDDYNVEFTEELDNLADSVLYNTKFYQTFESQILDTETLLNNVIDTDSLSPLQFKLIYTHVITIMETYLSDALINTILSNDNYIEIFVKTFYTDQKIPLNKVLETANNIKSIIKKALLGVIFHNLDKVGKIYKNVLEIDFKNISDIETIISNRHDLIHRNGVKKDGTVIVLTRGDVEIEIKKIKEFIEDIDEQLNRKITT